MTADGVLAHYEIWRLNLLDNQSYQLISVNSGKCLDVTGISQAIGALMQQWDCGGPTQTNQLFDFTKP